MTFGYFLPILLATVSMAAIGTLGAESITYDFGDADGVVDANTFGNGVTAGNIVLTDTGGGVRFLNGRAELGVREPEPTAAFTLTIPASVTVNLTGLAFDYGFNETTHPNALTPGWSLAVSTGAATPAAGSLGPLPSTGYFSRRETATLTGLTGLTNTTVTITWTFDSVEGRTNNFSRAHTLDNITLTGTVAANPNPPPTILSFTATPAAVDDGETATLSWEAADFDTLTINPGVGDVTTLTTNGIGSTGVAVTADTTYTLTATNAHGADTATAQVRLRGIRPNILLVLIDDMGTEDTSVDFNYRPAGTPLAPVDPTSVGLPAFASPGNGHFRTPAMESLAATGMKFTRAYAAPVCSPTRISILTGKNAARHGTTQFLGGGGSLFNLRAPANPGLTAANRTLAEILRDAGYRTIIAGKGHIGGAFDSSAGNYTAPAPPAADFFGFQVNVSASNRGSHGSCYANAATAFGLPASGTTAAFVAEYQDMTWHDLDPAAYPTGHPLAAGPVFVTEALTREMNERIESSVSEGLPFFAYLPHFAVHDPHQPDPRFTANYPGLTGDVLNFATMIEGIDKSLGDTLARLDQLGVAEDTLVIFAGDNGSDSKPRGPQNPPTLTMSNPLRGEKGMRHEGGTRVPLIISWAKRDPSNTFQQALAIPAASRTDDLAALHDLFPTILAAAGIPAPATDDAGAPLVIDGHDLGPCLRGTPGSHRPQFLATHFPNSSRSNFFATLHQDDWKLIYNFTSSPDSSAIDVPLGSYELYQLSADPHEATNLADPATLGHDSARLLRMARGLARELNRLGAPYPSLIAASPELASLGLPASPGDPHPVILPALPGIDTDGDGLADLDEDPNRNGLADPGETDPAAPDSDRDGTSDGTETALGTDPLDPSNFFSLRADRPAGGPLTLTWPSRPGNRFEVRFSPDLADWTDVIEPDLPAADPGTTTTYTPPPPATPSGFYQVELK